MAQVVEGTYGQLPLNVTRWSEKLTTAYGGLRTDLRDAGVDFTNLDPIAKLVNNCMYESQDYFQMMRRKWQDWDRQYFGIPNPKKYPWMSNLWIPATHRAIWILLARYWKVLFGNSTHFFGIEGVEDSDVPFEPANEQLIQYQWRQGKANQEFMMSMLQLLTRGTTVMKAPWVVEMQTRSFLEQYEEPIYQPVTDPATGEAVLVAGPNGLEQQMAQVGTRLRYKRSQKDVVTYRGTRGVHIDLHDYFPDPRMSSPEDASGYQIHRAWTTFAELKALEKRVGQDGETIGLFTGVDRVRDSRSPVKPDYQSIHRRLYHLGLRTPNVRSPEVSSYGATVGGSKVEKSLGLQADVELLEWHGPFDINNDNKLERCIITVANRQHVVRMEEDPYFHGKSHFVRGIFKPTHTRDFYGQGVCELVESLQDELNTKRNQRIDNVNQILQQILVYVEGSIDSAVLQNFQFRPGNRLKVKTNNPRQHLVWMAPNDVTGPAVREEEYVQRDISQVIPAPSIYTPESVAGVHPTAEGVATAHREADASIAILIELVEEHLLIPLIERYHWNNQQFITSAYATRILGPDGRRTLRYSSPEEVGHNMDFYPIGAMNAAKRITNQQALMRFLEIMRTLQMPVTDEQGQQYIPNLKWVMEQIWRLDDLGDASKLFLALPPQPQAPMGAEGMPQGMEGGMEGGAGAAGPGGIGGGEAGGAPGADFGPPNMPDMGQGVPEGA